MIFWLKIFYEKKLGIFLKKNFYSLSILLKNIIRKKFFI